MKIYSWNMLFRNTDLDRAFSFIKSLDFDVFCLQEVPEKNLLIACVNTLELKEEKLK